MELWLTENMFGKRTECLVQSDNLKEVFQVLDTWKTDSKNVKQYKIESYNRIIFGGPEKGIAIDFGDYTWFMLIIGTDYDKLKQSFMM